MWPKAQFLADLFAFTEEILNGKLHFAHLVAFTKEILNGKLHLLCIVIFFDILPPTERNLSEYYLSFPK